ncbi:MAG TPA: aldehyde dehydrogenase family protein [bacterium]|nr:aldehyde dehydrogenase family protein [bacterium]
MEPKLLQIYNKQKQNSLKIAKTSADARIHKLKKIRTAILEKRTDIQRAIHADFQKHPLETDLTEIYPVLSEISHAIRHLKAWMKPKAVGTPLLLYGTKSEIRYEPKGVVLILSPWNYPFQLCLIPLMTALAAGNTVIIKPSSKVPRTATFLQKFVSELFEEDEVAVLTGDADVADALLELPFDHIFFTGSIPVGKKVMAAAAKHLTPVTLELGGKSPVIIHESADIQKTAERVMWGKFVNAGQTCVAADYAFVHKSVHDDFVSACQKIITTRYGKNANEQKLSPDYCRLVSRASLGHLKKLLDESLAKGAKLVMGGHADVNDRYLCPTMITNVTLDSPLMQEEIFGPILPLITFDKLDEVYDIIRSRPRPLALYVFAKDNHFIETILNNTSSGGACINTLMVHLANNELPFGGIGYSGMGNYHGHFGFRTFSHERAVLRQGCLDTLKHFYPPYTERVKQKIDWALKFVIR